MKTILFSWIGFTDLKASKGDKNLGLGPIAQAVSEFGSLEVHHVFGGVFALMFLVVVASPSFWRTWASFAADPDGVYFPDRRGRWHRIPWARVGNVRIEKRTSGSGGSMRHLVVYADLTDEERQRIAPFASALAKLALPAGSHGVPLGLVVVDNFGNLEHQLQQIEALRS